MENCTLRAITRRAINDAFRRNWVVRAKEPPLHAPTSTISWPPSVARRWDSRVTTRTVIRANCCCSTCRFLPTNLISLPLRFESRFLVRGHLRALEFRLNARNGGDPKGVARCSNNGNGGKISRNTALSIPIKRIFPLFVQSRELNSSSVYAKIKFIR